MLGLRRHMAIHVAFLGLFAAGTTGCALSDYQAPPDTTGTGGSTSTGGGMAGPGGMMGAGGGSTQAGGSGGGMPGGEDCLDGVDNDGDLLIDCEDPDCQPGYECVPDVPAEFEGIYRIDVTANDAAESPCPAGGSPEMRYTNPSNANCKKCTCAFSETCSAPVVNCFGDSMCGGNTTVTVTAGITKCEAAPMVGSDSTACRLQNGSEVVSGPEQCTAGGAQLAQPTKFQGKAQVCGSARGAGCDAGKVCVPRSNAAYGEALCIAKDGAVACPAEFGHAVQTYTDANDSRACSDCSCNPSKLSCPPATVAVFATNVCGEGTPITGDCTPLPESLLSVYAKAMVGAPQQMAGACSGGAPTGALEPTGLRTYCCNVAPAP